MLSLLTLHQRIAGLQCNSTSQPKELQAEALFKEEFLGKPKTIEKAKKKKKKTRKPEKLKCLVPTVTISVNPSMAPGQINIKPHTKSNSLQFWLPNTLCMASHQQ